jgi:hypothetical protein
LLLFAIYSRPLPLPLRYLLFGFFLWHIALRYLQPRQLHSGSCTAASARRHLHGGICTAASASERRHLHLNGGICICTAASARRHLHGGICGR